MKKIVFFMALVICLTGCGKDDKKENTNKNNEIINLQDDDKIETNENNIELLENNIENEEEALSNKGQESFNELENSIKVEEDENNDKLQNSVEEKIEEKSNGVLEPATEDTNTTVTTSENIPIYEEGIDVGKKAIDFEVSLLSGEKVKLSVYLGKPIFLNFWATWCGPCVGEMPDIEKIKNEYGDKIVILAINGGELESDVKAFIDRKGYTFSVGIDERGSILSIYDSMYIPLSLFIDKNGVIYERHVGALSEAQMKKIVDELLNKE